MDSERDDDCLDRYLDARLRGEARGAREFWEADGEGDESTLREMEEIEAATARKVGRSSRPGRRIGDFELVAPLATGGMGSVWLARQTSLGRTVALKILRESGMPSPAAAARIRREAESLAALQHPGVVPVYDYGIDGDTPWLAMEYIAGRTLADWIAEARERGEGLLSERVVGWFLKIAQALAAAHARGIVHRDIKPANILIDERDQPRLIDFGIAWSESGSTHETVGFLGSPPYASPEQWTGGVTPVGPSSDLWSLGVCLYECLTGRLPFTAPLQGALAQVIQCGEFVPLHRVRGDLPRDLSTLVSACLEPSVPHRYACAEEVAQDLERIRQREPIRRARPHLGRRVAWWVRRRPRLSLAAAGVLLIATVATVAMFWRERAEARKSREEAATQITTARARISACEALRHTRRTFAEELSRLREQSRQQGLSGEQDLRLTVLQTELARAQLQLALELESTRDSLALAEQADPRATELGPTRLAWCFEKWALAAETQDRETAIHFRDRILREDERGAIGRRVLGENALTITTDPPGAAIHLFRVYDQHDLDPERESREVPVGVPVRSESVPMGAAAWRFDPHATDEAGRHALFLDPRMRPVGPLPDPQEWVGPTREFAARGLTVDVLDSGRRVRTPVTSTTVLRPTLIPLPCEPGNLIATSPAVDIAVLPGNYVAIARLPGHVDRRILFRVPHRGLHPESVGVTRHAGLLASAQARPGMVWISCDEPNCPERPFWILETEVTRRQYEAFLETQADREDLRSRLVPPDLTSGAPLSAAAHPDEPIVWVSGIAAQRYADWRNQVEGVVAHGWEYALPTLSQWTRAHGNVAHYAFGNVFHARQVNSRFASDAPKLAPVMSYPLDESRWGVYDLAGSAQEWLLAFRDGPDGRDQALGGGSWLDSDPSAFRASHLRWLKPDEGTAATGFRLVLQPKEAP